MFRRLQTVCFTTLFSILVALAPTPPAQAGLSDALDEMFMSTGTAPGVYQSQRRGIVAGGAYSLRWPTRTIWLAHIAPPKLSAGCGGLDFFGGSFSFISAEEFKQMLRQIGSAAVGYAFQLAIATICQPCSSTMAWLEEMMNAINSSEVSSCAIGAKIVSSIASPMKSDMNAEAQKELERIEMAAGGATDFLGALKETFLDPGWAKDNGSYVKTTIAAGRDTGGVEKIGNITFRVLIKSGVAAQLGGILTGSSQPDRNTVETLISLVGTVIYPQDPKESWDNGGCAANPANAESDCMPTEYHRVFSLENLLSSRGDSTTGDRHHQMWWCNTWNESPLGCMSMRLGEYNGHTIDQLVHQYLFGHTDINNLAATADSIVGRVQNGNELTLAQQGLLAATPYPILQLLQSVGKEPAAVAALAKQMEEPIAYQVALHIGVSVTQVINTAFSADKQKPAMPTIVKEGLDALGRDMAKIAARTKPHVSYINELIAYAKAIRASVPDETVPSKQRN